MKRNRHADIDIKIVIKLLSRILSTAHSAFMRKNQHADMYVVTWNSQGV